MSKKDVNKEPSEKKEKKTEESVKETEAQTEEEKADPVKELESKVEKLESELKGQKDLLLRTAAEYDNYRKRTEREKAAVYTDATADTIGKFLVVADNLERALAQEDCSVEDLRKGVEMVNKQLLDALEKLGVSVMGEAGEPFNPELHNAVSHIEDENLGENVIAAVFQKGYRMGDKIVRHAMVQVAN